MKQLIILCVVATILSGCFMFNDNSQHEIDIKDKYWKLIYYNDENVIYSKKFKREAHIIFKSDGKVAGNGSCNALIGSYKVKKNEIIFSPISTTLMLCGDDENKMEYNFIKFLNSINKITYEIEGDTLFLQEGENMLTFKTMVLE